MDSNHRPPQCQCGALTKTELRVYKKKYYTDILIKGKFVNLYTKNIPNPDLLIRTGGEMRLSNFLLWDLAYTELMFVDKMWPDFDKDVLDNCLITFDRRVRNYGV